MLDFWHQARDIHWSVRGLGGRCSNLSGWCATFIGHTRLCLIRARVYRGSKFGLLKMLESATADFIPLDACDFRLKVCDLSLKTCELGAKSCDFSPKPCDFAAKLAEQIFLNKMRESASRFPHFILTHLPKILGIKNGPIYLFVINRSVFFHDED